MLNSSDVFGSAIVAMNFMAFTPSCGLRRHHERVDDRQVRARGPGMGTYPKSLPYPGTTGAYLAIVDTFVVSSDAKDGVNAMKFVTNHADPKASLAFNKVKGSVPFGMTSTCHHYPPTRTAASESLWKDRILLSITHGELMSTDFHTPCTTRYRGKREADAFIDTLQNSIEVQFAGRSRDEHDGPLFLVVTMKLDRLGGRSPRDYSRCARSSKTPVRIHAFPSTPR